MAPLSLLVHLPHVILVSASLPAKELYLAIVDQARVSNPLAPSFVTADGRELMHGISEREMVEMYFFLIFGCILQVQGC